jgi:hypothetical protein
MLLEYYRTNYELIHSVLSVFGGTFGFTLGIQYLRRSESLYDEDKLPWFQRRVIDTIMLMSFTSAGWLLGLLAPFIAPFFITICIVKKAF